MANNSAKTSLGDMADVARVFNKFDANGDGKISKMELKAVLEAMGSHVLPHEVDQMMAEMDMDGDGSIDLAEFAAFHSGGSSSETQIRDAFEIYDQDRDGKISARELQEVLRKLGEKHTVKECKKMIAAVDLDGDGCVDFEEFKKMMKT